MDPPGIIKSHGWHRMESVKTPSHAKYFALIEKLAKFTKVLDHMVAILAMQVHRNFSKRAHKKGHLNT